MLTPEQRRLRASMGGNGRWAKENPAQHVAAMHDKFDQRFLREVDPDNALPEAERNRRADHARRLYFKRLALKSSQARARKSTGGEAA